MNNLKNFKHKITAKCTIYLIPKFNGMMEGKLFSEFYNKSFTFQNEFEMLKDMEDMFNSLNFPQQCCTDRKFEQKNMLKTKKKVDGAMDNKIISSGDEFKSTFIVNVLYRKNASWQGTITWVEQNLTQNFRSTFEMLKLMEQANNQGEIQTVKWEE